MEKIFIENVQVGISKGGIACGPVDGHVVVEARIKDASDKVSFYGVVEVEGTVNFFRSDESIYESEIEEKFEEEFPAAEGYSDYYEFYEEMEDLKEVNMGHALLLKYLACLARLDWEEIEQLKKDSVGKAIGEFEIPVCDAEEEYLEDEEEEYDELPEPGEV